MTIQTPSPADGVVARLVAGLGRRLSKRRGWASATDENISHMRLRVRGENGDACQVTFNADSYLPHWPAIVDLIVTTAFAERPVCFAGYEPPYLDADFAELSARRRLVRLDGMQYVLAFADRVTPASLLAATHTQDFELRQLYIAAIPEWPQERAELFIAALEHKADVLGQALARPLGTDEISVAYVQADAELLRATAEEFAYRDQDGAVLVWCHPDGAALRRCITTLRELAQREGLILEVGAEVESM